TWGESPSPLVLTDALIPPCAHTEWDRFTGTRLKRSTGTPTSHSLMTVVSPARPPPTTITRRTLPESLEVRNFWAMVSFLRLGARSDGGALEKRGRPACHADHGERREDEKADAERTARIGGALHCNGTGDVLLAD